MTSPGPAPLDAKRGLRARLRAARVHQPPSAAGLRAVGRRHLGSCSVVTAYAAVPGEPDPALLRASLVAGGVVVLLPLVRGSALAWGADDGALVPGPRLPSGLAIPEPSSAGPLGPRDADVVLLPALAADLSGARLGQGGGYYDRALAELADLDGRRPLLVAVVHDDELLPAGTVPVEPHDHRVDAVLTPRRWVDLR